METKLEANGLRWEKIKSEIIPLPFTAAGEADTGKIIPGNIKDESSVVAYMDFCILIGRYRDGQFFFYKEDTFEYRYLRRLRVFNPREELLLWRSGAGFNGRMRRDESGEKEVEVVETHQVLFGTIAKPRGDKGFTEISEDRGTRLILPFEKLNIDNKRKRIFIKTRNYITYNELCQAGYSDCRFLCFTDGKEPLSWEEV